MRDGDVAKLLGIEVMVDEHLLGFGERYRLLQAVDAVERIEVETENELGLGYQFFGKLGIARIDDNLFRTLQKKQVPRQQIGNDHVHLLAQPIEKMIQPQRSSYGIAIGRNVASNDDLFFLLYQFAYLLYFFFRNYFVNHLSFLTGSYSFYFAQR